MPVSNPVRPTFTGQAVTGLTFAAGGLTGATATSRYAGATASGAPASGTFAVGDFVVDQTGKIFVCTAAGTPGTWVQIGTAVPTSLTYQTGAQASAAPNATVNVASLTANVGTTDGDMALTPKGAGALLAQTPDGTATGGNKRGASAVDLTLSRGAAINVASGTNSVAIGGQSLTASGNYSTAVGGTSSTAVGAYSVVAGNAAYAQYGAFAFASGGFSAQGDAQLTAHVLRGTSSTGTPALLTADGAAPSSGNILNTGTRTMIAMAFRATVICKVTGASVLANYWEYAGLIFLPNVGTPSLRHSALLASYTADYPAASVTITADTTNRGLQITGSQSAGSNLVWVASVVCTEIGG